MARVCAAIRKNPRMSSVSMRDIYMNPTIARLAHHLDSSIDGFRRDANRSRSTFPRTCRTRPAARCRSPSTRRMRCWASGFSIPAINGRSPPAARLNFTRAASRTRRGSFVALTAISIVAKWLLIGRFKAQSIPIWSLAYFRFWAVKTLMRTSPATALHRDADLQRLSAPDGRQDRPQRRHQLPPCAGLHRPAHDRRQHHPAQGQHRPRLSRAIEFHPASGRSRSAATRSSAKRACSISTPRWATTRSSAMPRRCRAASACRTASAITARPRSRRRPTIARSRAGTAARSAARSTASLELAALCMIAVPLPILCLLFLGSVCDRGRRTPRFRRVDAVAARRFGGLVLRRDRLRAGGGLCRPAPVHDVPASPA